MLVYHRFLKASQFSLEHEGRNIILTTNAESEAPVLITEPAEGIPELTDTPEGLTECAEALRAGSGPVAIDTERASGFRYGQRAFLVQLKREGSGIWLIDPEPLENLDIIQQAIGDTEWILHAATQDLGCLADCGLRPCALFDTELAGRLCGFQKVNLAALLQRTLGITLAKEHSAADWSQRPLPERMRNYAALDVEFLVPLRTQMIHTLRRQDKLEIATEEFEALTAWQPPEPPHEPWRKTSGIHRVKSPQQLAIVRALWHARDELGRQEDVFPGRLLPDRAIIAAATAQPATAGELMNTKGFTGRAAGREKDRWLEAIRRGVADGRDPATRPEKKPAGSGGPPPVKRWKSLDELAARRFATCKVRLTRQAEAMGVPLENLLLPSTLRDLCWRPPSPITPETVEEYLKDRGARNWQVWACSAIITVALLDPDPWESDDEQP
ncbi:HRDC domain-containing protein [Auritidibacter ignavus]|uniref:HRDC domain-containing protein n=1 Tax=Auritidibacter ignavus TaxID=678932 RepID=UPI0024B9E6DF|nr:HRDC domain-containing protein [Auritidibacter ignavus]WHS34706.1 HRDC domain-containing protein [Auritidibacter ignavus]